jgi:superfamily II DNA/RNA helicase
VLGICQCGPFELATESAFRTRTELSILNFLDLGVDASVVGRLEALGIKEPLPVQAATIPDALAGKDIYGQAPTGSGKTLAFGLPLLASSSGAAPGRPRALVLVPTRELADQVCGVLSSLLGKRSHRVVAVFGGSSYTTQRRALQRGVDIVVACPGRLEDLIARGTVDLSDVRTVVLDEADRMVDMGFVKPVYRLIDQTTADRQLLMFSATDGKAVEAISRRYQNQPTRYQVEAEPNLSSEVTHLFWRAPRPERVKITAQLIAQHGRAFVFCRTKQSADRVARQLRAAGVDATPIHGNRSQPQRARALAAFASSRTRALVGTDVVARGIHIDDVPCVVHFDPPADAETYVHRSGRTGRVGNTGTVVSLVPDESRDDVRALQRVLGFPRTLTIPFQDGSPASSPRTQDGPPADKPKKQDGPPTAKSKKRAGPGSSRASGRDGRTMAGRVTGTVKFFDSRRGYGFLSRPDGDDVFVHQSRVSGIGDGRASLAKGEQVSFQLATGRRGDEAHDVVIAGRRAS